MALIRLRKYRIFLAVTVCCLLVVYFVSRGAPTYSPDTWPGFGKTPVGSNVDPAGPEPATFPLQNDANPPTKPDKPQHVDVPEDDTNGKDAKTPPPSFNPTDDSLHDDAEGPGADDLDDTEDDEDNDDTDVEESNRIHWTAKADTYPVPTGSIIPLPTGTSKSIPKIQHKFAAESSTEHAERQKKLDAIKASMQRAWKGYKEFAWMKDELKPLSGGYKASFNGWGATLVDSLDTLWIMGMKQEFEEAVDAVKKIDFTTSESSSLGLFETTIRYLGGLLGAYDVSGAKYPVLLEKAIQLGNVMMGAFDTPNRMPILRYSWAGTRKTNPDLASSGAVLAEFGSLSLEFTRLAQLTKDSKYYDAVARITNALAEYQNRTGLPGLWPLSVDLSECATNADGSAEDETDDEELMSQKDTSTWGEDRVAGPQPNPQATEDDLRQKDQSTWGKDRDPAAKRQITPDNTEDNTPADDNEDEDDDENLYDAEDIDEDDDGSDDEASNMPSHPKHCTAHLSGGYYSRYSIGGEGDSTYEYLPKEYLLLGGLNNQYKEMYTAAAEGVKEHLLYRAMIDDETRELLFTGKYSVSNQRKGSESSKPSKGTLNPSVGHLSCFQGAMFALSAKIFNRPADLEIGSKMTDACVWAYEKSASGIMPDDITPIPCSDMHQCPWNQTAWWLALDPAAARRPKATEQDSPENKRRGNKVSEKRHQKRQMDEKTKLKETHQSGKDETGAKANAKTHPHPHPGKPNWPKGPNNGKKKGHELTHEEYVQKVIKSSGFWPGIKEISSDSYLLRPEAIESVWYMYRITGDDIWRQKGWRMFEAVEAGTKTTYGNSAISSVSSSKVRLLDQAESFWTAETLKYFYLLFSSPDVICLDDYVLNTEAHPFLRPDTKKK